ncbi:polymer-forming cytoskeletal protein [Patescibacteria group bacterium]|nr:polymer-forming cytoskeletal protein [Patescibacteria group bacterium]
MKYIQKRLFILLVVCLFFGAVAHADAAVIRSGTTVAVTESDKIDGDFYALGDGVHVSGVITGDLYVIGGTVTVDGEVKGDIVVLGSTVTVHGKVGDDVRILGGKAILASAIGGDVFGGAGTLSLLSSGSVAGDVIFYGGSADIDGPVKGRVYTRSESLAINASVGSVDTVLEGQLSLGNSAVVSGNLDYETDEDIARDPGSSVVGTVNKRADSSSEDSPFFVSFVSVMFMTLFVALIMVLLFRTDLTRMFALHTPRMGLCGFIGLGVLIGTPLLSVLLGVTILGMLAALLLSFLYLALLVAALIVMHIYVGAYVLKVLKKEHTVSWLSAVVGVLLTQSLFLVPVLGPLLVLLAFLITLGTIVFHIFTSFRS